MMDDIGVAQISHLGRSFAAVVVACVRVLLLCGFSGTKIVVFFFGRHCHLRPPLRLQIFGVCQGHDSPGDGRGQGPKGGENKPHIYTRGLHLRVLLILCAWVECRGRVSLNLPW